jgi:hypothetical protein
MTTFDEREKSFEKKFAIDQERKFKAAARRTTLLAEWAAARLGLSGTAVGDYIKALHKVEVEGKGGDAVIKQVLQDLTDKGVAVSATELNEVLQALTAKVEAQLAEKGS